jgi:iron complex transport system substrate-binding protein
MKFRMFLLCSLLMSAVISTNVLMAQDEEADFPVTIEHKFGSTTITEAPERVVSIGFTDQDPLLALGVKPVAIRYFYGDEENAIFPWAEDEADGLEPVILNMPTLNFEAILELDPDLIVSVYSGITEEEYETLSQIAPTIAQSGDYFDWGTPWDVATRMIGAAVGKTEEAETLIEAVEVMFEEVREQNPIFGDTEIVVAYNFGETYGFFPSQDPRGNFFEQLGFTIPEELNEIAGENYYADVSSETLDLLDQDFLVFLGLENMDDHVESIENHPIMKQLDVLKEDHVLYVPKELDDALQFSTILSLPYLIEGIVPEIQEVLDS